MNRRALLASLGTLTLAGCTAGGGGSETDTTDEPTSTEPPAETTPEPETPSVGVPTDRADGPPWDDGVTRVVSWAEAREGSPLRLTPPTQEGSLPNAAFRFTLENHTDVRFESNFYGWSVWKRVDGEWFRVAPRHAPDPLMFVEPGAEHGWTLAVEETEPGSPVESVEGSESLGMTGLGGGTYAFAVDGWFSTEDRGNGVGLAARFELGGDALKLTPSNAVTETTREGDTVVVEADFETDAWPKGDTVVVERLGDGDDVENAVRRVIPEQAIRDQRLRNSLPFFEAGVSTVRLKPTASSWPAFGVGDGVVEYGGTRYRVTVEGLESSGTETAETATTER